MQLNLRQAIIQRVQNKSVEELLEIINTSVNTEERSLPGLGVLFEMVWEQIDDQVQLQLADALKQQLVVTEIVES